MSDGRIQTRVAIVGRPNVGKSTLFNILTASRKALVKDQTGVTRDLIFESAEIWGKTFEVVDTGGITEAEDLISSLIRDQVIEFLSQTDLLLVIMDGRAGLLPEDRDLIRIVSKAGKPYLLIVNKIDSELDVDMHLSEFHEFGVPLAATSFESRRGLAPVLEWIHTNLPEANDHKEPGIRIALVGKPNAGKSSLVNRLVGENRMIVSEIPGTTTDAVETPFYFNDTKMIKKF
jgi:GTP-binding protein